MSVDLHPIYGWGNNFSQKFFWKFFANTLHAVLNPPFPCQNVIYGGDTVGGRGPFNRRTPHATIEKGVSLLITLIDNLVDYYLGMSILIGIFVCNLFNRGGPSRLQPALYFYIRIPHFNWGNICLSQMLLLYLYVITILYLTLPVIVYNIYCVLRDPVRRMYDWTIKFLEL